MKHIFIAAVMAVMMLFSNFSVKNTEAAAVPVTDVYPEQFIAFCMDKLEAQKKGIKLSAPINDEEFSNIEGMDAWASAVIREQGNFVLTLQTDKKNRDAVMAMLLTISYDADDPNNDVAANMILATDFLPVLSSVIGLNDEEYKLLLGHDFTKVPHEAIWVPSINRTIMYQVVVHPENRDVYFWIMASDVHPDEAKKNESEEMQ